MLLLFTLFNNINLMAVVEVTLARQILNMQTDIHFIKVHRFQTITISQIL